VRPSEGRRDLKRHEPERTEERVSHPQSPHGFVGRRPDLAQLGTALRRVAEGHGRVVVVRGEAGIGKTWLVRRALADPSCPIEPARIHWARCSDAAGAPTYWPWRALFGSQPGSLARLDPARSMDTADRFEQLHAMARLVRDTCADGPTVLVVEDLQWADTESVMLLDTLAPEIDAVPLLILATLRDDDGPHRPELTRVLRHREVGQLSLTGFDPEETEDLLADRVGAQAEPDDLLALCSVTGGNPYFLDELVRDRSIDEIRGFGALREAAGIAKTLVDQLARHIEAMAPDSRRLLEWAAVLGTSFSWAQMIRFAEEAIPDEPAPSRAALDRALSGRLLELDERPGRIRFVHPLVASAVLRDLPRLDLARLYGLAGTLLARELGEGPGSAAALAPLFTKAAHLPEFAGHALRHSIRAGYEAALQHAHDSAAEHYRNALDLLEVPGADVGFERYGRPEVLLALGQRVALTTPLDADEILSEAERLADDLAATDEERAARVAALALVIRCEELPPLSRSACRSTYVRAEGVLDRIANVSGALRARLLAAMVPLLRFESDRVEPTRLAGEALRVAEVAGDSTARARALEAAHWTRSEEAGDEGRLEVVSRILHEAEQRGDVRLAATARIWRYADLLELGRTEEAEGDLLALETAAAGSGEPRRRLETLCMRAGMELHLGRLQGAEALAHDAIELGRRIGIPAAANPCEATLTRIAIERGEPVSLEEENAEDMARFEVVRSSSSYRHFLAGMHGSAWNDLAAVLHRGLDSIPFGPEWLATLHTLAWSAIELRDTQACAEIYARLEPRAGRCVVYPLGAATGSSDRVLMRLATVLERHDEAERHFQAGVAFLQRSQARCELAKLYLDHAKLRIERGEDPYAAAVQAELEAALRPAREQGWIFVERSVLALCPTLDAQSAVSAAERAGIEGTFLRRADGWEIGLGARTSHVDDLLGLHFIAALLTHPGEEVLATELLHRVTGHEEDSIEKARLRVTARVRTALRRLGETQPEVADHLRLYLRTGKHCGYLPRAHDRVSWDVERR